MNRRKIILILTIVLIVAIGLAIYFSLSGRKSTNLSGVGSGGGSPFGGSSSLSNSGQGGEVANQQVASSTDGSNVYVAPRLRQITTVPTAGDIVLTSQVDVIQSRIKTTATEHTVRYIDRATGHIFDINIDSPAAEEISNTTIPKVYEATFLPSGNSLIARLLSDTNPDQILTYSITMKDKKTSVSATSTNKTVADIGILSKNILKDVSGSYLTPDIKELAISPSGSKILSSFYISTGGKLTLSNPDGSAAKNALIHPLREWLLALISDTKAVITTKPSGTANGYAYTLNTASGNLTKIIGGIAGLTVLPNTDGDTYLIAGSTNSQIRTFAYFAKAGKQVSMPFSTLPEKCIWANTEKQTAYCAVPEFTPQGTYPDAWYQGRVSFTDEIWKVNVSTGETTLISNLPKESGQKIDAINLKLSSDDSYLTFINKVDLTLWGLNLSQKS